MQQSNEAQFEAIHHGDGPMMVLAGPGAGKTFVITNRVAYLITELKVPPEEILVVTFSRAAATEMKERFDVLTNYSCPAVRFGTFHSVFFEILKKAYHYEAKDIVTDSLKFRFIAESLADTGFEVEDKQEFLESIEKEVSKVKSDGKTWRTTTRLRVRRRSFAVFLTDTETDCLSTEHSTSMIWSSTRMSF